MEFFFSQLQSYKLQLLALSVFKIMENSWENVCWGFITGAGAPRSLQKSRFLEDFQKGQLVYLNTIPPWFFLLQSFQKVSKQLFCQNTNRQVRMEVQTFFGALVTNSG